MNISNRHLVFWTVMYDTSDLVPPLVYVEDTSLNGTLLERTESDFVTATRMGKDLGPVLLKDGDFLRLPSGVSIRFNGHAYLPQVPVLDEVQQLEIKLFDNQYDITDRRLGSGSQGHVVLATNRASGKQVACKVIGLNTLKRHEEMKLIRQCRQTSRMTERDATEALRTRIQHLQMEHDILNGVDHPNIITIEKVFFTSYNMYIIQELITGGDLFSYVASKEDTRLSEAESAVIIQQVIRAVEYLHDRGIAHRDIKPENVLMTSRKAGCRVVLTDFGLAKRITASNSDANKKAARMFTEAGTFPYMAPEVYQKSRPADATAGYSGAIDMWSIGAMTTFLLTGEQFFAGDVPSAVRERATRCDLSMLDDPRNQAWSTVGARPKAFIKALLVLDENLRLTAKQALRHAWFTKHTYASEFEAVYQRAIRDWKPSPCRTDLVITIDTSHLGVPAEEEDGFLASAAPAPDLCASI